MGLIDRAKNIIITPKTEWDVVAAENTSVQQIIVGYVLPLAAAAAIASFIGSSLFMGMFGARMGIGFGLVSAIVTVIMAVVSVFVLAFIVDALAPTFGGQKSFVQAVKVVAYSYTAAWVFGLLAIIPVLGWLAALVGGLYGLYLLYLGLPRLMRAPQEKAVGYVVVVIVCAIVLWFVISMITAAIGAMGMAGMAYSGAHSPSSSITFDKDSKLGQLEAYSKKMEEAGKKMEAAQKSGDPNKEMAAAMGALGTALSGGKGVEPVQLDVLKPMLPDKFAGLPRTGQRSDRSGVAGLMAAKVEGEYGSEGKNATLVVTDTGGAAGLMGLAAWAALGASTESEDDNRIERMRRDGKRMVHEEISKKGGQNKYSVILSDRFVVEARGTGVDFDTLKSSVASLDLGKLESMK